MSVLAVYASNFKGIAEPQWIELRRITLFIGANSSGKSTCIHALACLAQTAKLPNSTRPLVLDDEYADVHLGRFIEAIHDRTYKSTIGLGLRVPHAVLSRTGRRREPTLTPGTLEAQYQFGSTLRTQDLSLRSLEIRTGKKRFRGAPKGDHLQIETDTSPPVSWKMRRGTGFFLHESLQAARIEPEEAVFDSYFELTGAQQSIQSELDRVFYVGPFRQPPLRRYPTRGASPRGVGPFGEATAALLANEVIQSQVRPHLVQVAKWLKTIGVAKAIDVTRVGRSDLFEVNLTLDDGAKFPIADLGYGLSQVLPVLVQCAFAPPDSTLLFEQPELHLHTLAARQLVNVFIDSTKSNNTKIVAETHSPQLVGQLQREIRAGRISVDEIAVYRVERRSGKSHIRQLQFEDDADIYEHWEQGISVQ